MQNKKHRYFLKLWVDFYFCMNIKGNLPGHLFSAFFFFTTPLTVLNEQYALSGRSLKVVHVLI